MEKKKITNEIRERLRKPFPSEALGKVASKTYLTSIKAQYIIERLNDVFGIGRWTYIHEVIKEQENQVLILGQLMLLDYDCEIPKQYGSHKIEGKGVEIADGYKSAITDGLTKSASYIEIGIDVFKGISGKKKNIKQELIAYKKNSKDFTEDFVKVMQYLKKDGNVSEVEKKYNISGDTKKLIINFLK